MSLYAKVWNIIRRGRVSAPPDDTGIAQKIQIQKSFGETASHESWSHYGFSSVPLVGCDVAMVSGDGGNQSKGLIVASNDTRYRPTGLAAGCVCLYDSDTQQILINPVTGKIIFNAKTEMDFQINGVTVASLTSAGLVSTKDGVFNGISVDNHIHTGVSTGSGDTGLPTG